MMACTFNRGALTAVLLVFALLAAPAVMAAKSANERLDNIERKLESRGLIDMLNRVEQLQQSLQEMRGEMEVQAHTLQQMQRQQRQQYLDVDRRLRQLESAPAAGIAAMPPSAAPRVGAPAVTAPPVVSVPPITAPAAGVGSGRSQPPTRPASKYTPPQAPVPGSIEQIGEQAEYDTALATLREGRYPEAAQAFKQFLVDHPGSSYADNAQYWLGEAYYVTRSFDRAQSTFQNLVATFPQSAKVPGSRLKIAYILYEKKDWAAARRELTGLVSAYPGTTVARQANERLQRMKSEGH